MRQIVQINVEDAALVGTYHRPRRDDETAPFDKGLLILNTGAAPRSGDGDLNAQLADRLMDLGYHVFRFDMPGLGDSPGELPEQVHTYHLFVKKGGNAPFVTSLVAALRQKYGLKGFVLLGNCGGSVTAAFVAAQKPDGVLGLVHFDPVFHNREESLNPDAPTTPQSAAVPPSPQKHGAKYTIRRCLDRLLGAGVATNMYRAITKRKLPNDTNFTLVHLWKQLEDMEMPMLVLLSHNLEDDEHWRALLRKSAPRTTCIEIRNTNHFFSTDEGKTQVFAEVKRWLLNTVPPQDQTARPSPAKEPGVSQALPV